MASISRWEEAAVAHNHPMPPHLWVSSCFSCRLFEILSNVLPSYYASKDLSKIEPGGRKQQVCAEVLSINHRLDDFSFSVRTSSSYHSHVSHRLTAGRVTSTCSSRFCTVGKKHILIAHGLTLMSSTDISTLRCCSRARCYYSRL